MITGQSTFFRAVLDPAVAVPDGLTDPQGQSDGKRFAVYRNNVAVSLSEALISAFPIIYKLVGDEFFRAMAGVFLRQHPPTSALLMHYGDEMPGFLRGFEPVEHLGYLPDIARLELAMRRSYHAADTPPIDPDLLQSMPPEKLMNSVLILAPSLGLIRSDWPIHDIWLVNTQSDAPPPKMQPQDVLVMRSEFDPAPVLALPGAGNFVNSLGKGENFGDALAAAGEGFDLTSTLGLLLSGGAIIRIENKE